MNTLCSYFPTYAYTMYWRWKGYNEISHSECLKLIHSLTTVADTISWGLNPFGRRDYVHYGSLSRAQKSYLLHSKYSACRRLRYIRYLRWNVHGQSRKILEKISRKLRHEVCNNMKKSSFRNTHDIWMIKISQYLLLKLPLSHAGANKFTICLDITDSLHVQITSQH